MFEIEIDKLCDGLEKRKISYTRSTHFDGFSVVCDGWDAVCNSFSFGHEDGLLEVYGTIANSTYDDVERYLTADEILSRLDENEKMKAVFVGGRLDGVVCNVDEVERLYCNGMHTDDLSEIRARGGLVHRAELDNQPKVDGYLGPMWDGGKLRYETQEVYNMLSC